MLDPKFEGKKYRNAHVIPERASLPYFVRYHAMFQPHFIFGKIGYMQK